MELLAQSVFTHLNLIRSKNPVVLNLTNYVAMDFNANALLALGASPVMAHAEEEIEEMVEIADTLVINIGTLDSDWISRMRKAVRVATRLRKPIVLDPVGAGATHLRTSFAQELLRTGNLSVLRGNASEVAAVLGGEEKTKGVDSRASSTDILSVALEASKKIQTTFVVSGATDFVFQEGKQVSLDHGDPLMAKVTAMGCTSTCLIGASLAVGGSSFDAAWRAMVIMGVAGEKAKSLASGPGSFRTAFLDSLVLLKNSDFSSLKVSFR